MKDQKADCEERWSLFKVSFFVKFSYYDNLQCGLLSKMVFNHRLGCKHFVIKLLFWPWRKRKKLLSSLENFRKDCISIYSNKHQVLNSHMQIPAGLHHLKISKLNTCWKFSSDKIQCSTKTRLIVLPIHNKCLVGDCMLYVIEYIQYGECLEQEVLHESSRYLVSGKMSSVM